MCLCTIRGYGFSRRTRENQQLSKSKGYEKMGKIKTHRASCKRYAVTGTGKVKVFHSDHRHNLGQKTQKRKRHLRSSQILSPAMTATVKRLIGKD